MIVSAPRLCYITDRLALGSRPLLPAILAAIEAGVDLIQIREKDLGTRDLLDLIEKTMASARTSATRVVVNDRLDVALAAVAHGVHLGGQSLPVESVRAAVRPEFCIGVSCHSTEEVWAAEAAGANYALLGPIFETASKLSYGPPLGLGVLAQAARGTRMPVFALGGITVERVSACIDAGAAGVAGISIFQQCESMAERAKILRRELAGTRISSALAEPGAKRFQ